MHRHPRTDTSQIGLGQKDQILSQHIARLEASEHYQNLGSTGDLGIDFLYSRRLGIDGIIEGRGPSRMPPVICPHSAIFITARPPPTVEGIFRGHRLHGGENRDARCAEGATSVNRSIAFWMISRLASRSGEILIAASVMNKVSA